MTPRTKLALASIVTGALAAAGVFADRSLHAKPRAAEPTPPSNTATKTRTVRADGRIVARPGAQVTVGAEAAGAVVKVVAHEGLRVKKGEVLLELRHAEQAAALQEARAVSFEAAARVRAREADLKRSRALVSSGSVARHEADATAEEQRVAAARLAAAQATITRLGAALDRTRVVAPIDGVVVERTIEEGETVVPGTPLFTIVDLDRLRVEAEIDEFDLGRVALGAVAEIRAESFPGQAWKGSVEEIPAALTKRRLRPLDPARPTDTSVLLAKVSLPSGTPLKVGQRVSLTLAEENEAVATR